MKRLLADKFANPVVFISQCSLQIPYML